jgi:hypothetical protein
MQDMATMPAGPDLSSMDYGQLMGLRERIDERVGAMRETEAPVLRERFAEAAAALSMTLDEVLGRRGRGRPPQREGE